MNMLCLIKNLKEEDIDSFIDERLSKISNTEEKEIGFKTNITCYSGFLDEKVKTNVTCDYVLVNGLMETYPGSITFDDREMYKFLIKEIKEKDCIYTAVKDAVNGYLGLDSRSRKSGQYKKTRSMIYHEYSSTMNKSLNINLFHRNEAAMCPEVAGVTQNMFKFLGIDSDYVVLGESNNGFHSFNIVYPIGRDKKAILYDFDNYCNNNPLICILDDAKKEALLSNKKIIITKEEINDTFGRDVKWKQKETDFSILKDGDPKNIADYKKPFTIERKLVYKI